LVVSHRIGAWLGRGPIRKRAHQVLPIAAWFIVGSTEPNRFVNERVGSEEPVEPRRQIRKIAEECGSSRGVVDLRRTTCAGARQAHVRVTTPPDALQPARYRIGRLLSVAGWRRAFGNNHPMGAPVGCQKMSVRAVVNPDEIAKESRNGGRR
jgi:hypothetical protein